VKPYLPTAPGNFPKARRPPEQRVTSCPGPQCRGPLWFCASSAPTDYQRIPSA